MANRKRPIILRCPVTAEERTLIEQKMAQLQTRRIGAYLRKMAIDGYIIYVDTKDIKEMNKLLSTIGRNINQIAKRVNAGGPSYQADMEEIRESLISHKWQKKKVVKSLRCRYLAKSHVVNCSAQSQTFDFVNFRGACFSKVNFKDAIFYGCDFWGTSFKDCSFQNVEFRDCVFMACKFKNCNLTNAKFSYSTIVNTSLAGCHNIDISSGVNIYNVYPTCKISDDLEDALQNLKGNRNLKKTKLLFISDTKYNYLNLFLLQRRYGDYLPVLLYELAIHSTEGITTYRKLERVLDKLQTPAII